MQREFGKRDQRIADWATQQQQRDNGEDRPRAVTAESGSLAGTRTQQAACKANIPVVETYITMFVMLVIIVLGAVKSRAKITILINSVMI
jgi:hypothetical protein